MLYVKWWVVVWLRFMWCRGWSFFWEGFVVGVVDCGGDRVALVLRVCCCRCVGWCFCRVVNCGGQ